MNTSQLKLNYSIGNFSDIKSLDDKTKEDLYNSTEKPTNL